MEQECERRALVNLSAIRAELFSPEAPETTPIWATAHRYHGHQHELALCRCSAWAIRAHSRGTTEHCKTGCSLNHETFRREPQSDIRKAEPPPAFPTISPLTTTTTSAPPRSPSRSLQPLMTDGSRPSAVVTPSTPPALAPAALAAALLRSGKAEHSARPRKGTPVASQAWRGEGGWLWHPGKPG